jgi:Zn-finger nucleic acid-binding protein
MNCLSCEHELAPSTHEGVEIDLCPECGGTWVDRTELQRLTATVDDATTPEEQQAELAAKPALDKLSEEVRSGAVRTCPKCSSTMRKQLFAEYSSIVLDDCAQCGIWLDGGELRRVEAYAEGRRASLLRGVASAYS